MERSTLAPVASLTGVSLRYGKTLALDDITLDIPAGRMVGLIGPDGVGKSSLLALASGARHVQQGSVHVLGGDMASAGHRNTVCPDIAYMPQGLGKNLYPSLSMEENLQFFGRLFGHSAAERRRRIDQLTRSTGLYPFLSRPAGQLSGGMRQKLGLCCALIHDPTLLILDEPTTGVDPLARAQFWDLIRHIRGTSPGMSVMVATAYMEEAQRFDWLMAMDSGRVLATGTPNELLSRTGSASLESAFIALLPEEKRRGHRTVTIPPLAADHGEIAIEAKDLTMRFGDFVAVDHVSFVIRRGEIFGFLGSNGCGKSTTMKMLTGLLPASEGQARLFGRALDPKDIATRRRVGYMSQADSGMDAGDYTFALDIPPNFQRDVLAGKSPAIQLNVDATRMTQAFTGSGYVQQIVSDEVNEFVQRHRDGGAPPVSLALRMRFNPNLDQTWFGALMEIINLVTMLSIILTGAALIREREHGTIEHLLVMPVTPAEIMLAKIWSMGLVVLLSAAAALVFIVQGVLGVPVEGSVALFLAGAALDLFATTSMGIFMATLARSMPQFGMLAVLIILPLQLLSGSVTPRESMPKVVQDIMLAAPTTHFVALGQAILYRGAGIAAVWPQFLALAAIGSVLFALSLNRFRKTIGQMA